ncbi:MAG TPA: hypothetical protein VL563_00670 [Gemmatimonadales bacterium]|nr:hypothetical protein [Gemmatimonadales bacterium]
MTAGPVTVYAQATRIVLQARVRFASVVVHGEWLDVGLWLRRRVRQRPRAHRGLRSSGIRRPFPARDSD